MNREDWEEKLQTSLDHGLSSSQAYPRKFKLPLIPFCETTRWSLSRHA
jgi:hypothetical protein